MSHSIRILSFLIRPVGLATGALMMIMQPTDTLQNTPFRNPEVHAQSGGRTPAGRNQGGAELRPTPPPSLRVRGERLTKENCARLAYELPVFTTQGLATEPNQIGANRKLPPVWMENAVRLGETQAEQSGRTLIAYAAAVRSPNAPALRLHFENVALPPDAELYVYGAQDDVVTGPHTGRGPFENGEFWSDALAGDTAVVEWLTPPDEPIRFHVTELTHIWESPPPPKPDGDETKVGACHLDAMCGPEPEKDSVARIVFQTSLGAAVCTGTILNTRNGDFAPFFLTANHCVAAAAQAQTVQAFWFYRTTNCNGGVVNGNVFRSPTGAALLQTGAAADQTLLEIMGVIPRNLFHAGWDVNARPDGTNVFALHHPGAGTPVAQPQSSFLRRSIGVPAGQNSNCNGSAGLQGGCRVNWNQGVTEPGSSGSGIWYASGDRNFLIGVLSCGPAACGAPPNQMFDNYGKFSAFVPGVNNFLNGGDDDAFEPNDNRAAARFVSPPVNVGNLVLKQVSEDWCAVQTPTGARLTATVNFTHNFGDIDLELYRQQEPNPVAVARGNGDSETIDFTNGGPAGVFFLRVYLADDTRNTYRMNLTVAGGDGPRPVATAACFRPTNGFFHQRFSNTSGFADNSFFYGQAGDQPIAGDWDGDGVDGVGVCRSGVFFLKNSNAAGFADLSFAYGAPGDIPPAGDWDGDGVDSVGVYRNGAFLLRNADSAGFPDIVISYGNIGDVPVVGDWDGDRTTTIGCFRPSNGFCYIRNSNTSGVAETSFFYGQAGDTPVAGDWTGKGFDSIGVYRNGVFFLRNTNTAGFADIRFNYGNPGDIPATGRWRR